MKAAALVVGVLLSAPVAAQEGGWHFSPLPGEGDRTALGCSFDSTPARHTCVAVRCEDDYSIGLHIETTRDGGDAGRWTLEIDDVRHELTAYLVPGSPYGARVEGDVAPILSAIKDGGEAFLDPVTGTEASNRSLPLEGSLYAINQALFFCAPPAPAAGADAEATEPVINPNLVPPEPAPQLTR